MLIEIDGSQGEGGGQVLRTSLALSMVTGQGFRITRVRAGRAKPGLMRQHLTCVQAAAEICSARITGAVVGSQEVTFEPGRIRPGAYHFRIGTAGGTTLVLQAVLPALLVASGPSSVTVEGGTHNSAAPPFEFLDRALLPLLARAGAGVRARLERHGFYPAGGGRIVIEADGTDPARPFRPLELMERGRRVGCAAAALLSRLHGDIAERELGVLRSRLGLEAADTQTITVRDPVGPGNALLVTLHSEHVTEVFSGVGEHGKSAERIAGEVSDAVRSYVASDVPVGPHLADQLMVPLAVMAGGTYHTTALTSHAATNAQVIARFGGRVEHSPDGVVTVFPLHTR